jgi:hypothetical protein
MEVASVTNLEPLNSSQIIVVIGSGIAQSAQRLGYGLDDRIIEVRFPAWQEIILFPIGSRPALRSTKSSIKRPPGGCFPGGKAAGA